MPAKTNSSKQYVKELASWPGEPAVIPGLRLCRHSRARPWNLSTPGAGGSAGSPTIRAPEVKRSYCFPLRICSRKIRPQNDFYLLKISECVPVFSINRTSSVSFCSQTSNQSGLRWHSHSPALLPESLWALYLGGSVPVWARMVITSCRTSMGYPRLMQSFQSFLNWLVNFTVYIGYALRASNKAGSESKL